MNLMQLVQRPEWGSSFFAPEISLKKNPRFKYKDVGIPHRRKTNNKPGNILNV